MAYFDPTVVGKGWSPLMLSVILLLSSASAADQPYQFTLFIDYGSSSEVLVDVMDTLNVHASDFSGCLLSTKHFDVRGGIIGAFSIENGQLAGLVTGEISPGVDSPFTPPQLLTCFTKQLAPIHFVSSDKPVRVHFAYAPNPPILHFLQTTPA